jgi:hypothetical protein
LIALNFTKYRKRYASAILAAYLMLVSISILHYHHINIQTGYFQISEDNEKACNDVFDQIVDITHECAIQHFTDTIITYNFTPLFNVTKEIAEQRIALREIPRPPQAPVYNNNHFRAPPIFS